MSSIALTMALCFVAMSPSGDDNTMQAAVTATRARVVQVGAFSVSASVDMRAVFPERDPDRVHELKMDFKSVAAGSRLRESNSTQFVWFPDEISPPQTLARDALAVYDGEKQVVYQTAEKEAWITSSQASDYVNPATFWITFCYGHSLDMYLSQNGAKCLGAQEVGGKACLAYETPFLAPDGSPDPSMTCRLWLDPSNAYFPMRMVYGKMQGTDLEVAYEVQTLRTDSTVNGIQYPVEVVQRLYASHEGRRLMYTERLYHFTDFTPAVPIDAATFRIDLPAGTTVHDEIAGVTYNVDDYSPRVAGELKRMTESAVALTSVDASQDQKSNPGEATRTEVPLARAVSKVGASDRRSLLLRPGAVVAAICGFGILVTTVFFILSRKRGSS